MFRTKRTMQQQWDDEITSYLDHATEELRAADRWDTLTSSRVGKWFHRLPITDLSTNHRAIAVDYRDTATRMETCPHNPRNGGTGWRDPEPSQLNALDKAFILLRLGYLLVIAGAVMFGWLLLHIRTFPDPSTSRFMLVTLEAGALGFWAAVVTTWVMDAVLDATAVATRYIRGVSE